MADKLIDAKESEFDDGVSANGNNKPLKDNGDEDNPVASNSIH